MSSMSSPKLLSFGLEHDLLLLREGERLLHHFTACPGLHLNSEEKFKTSK